MDDNKLRAQWLLEENTAFQGWGFSCLNGRWHHEKEKWDYIQIVRGYLKPEHMLLDMGTGGGEVLLTLGHPYHLTSVTESYPPNVDLCFQKLAPLGITVKQVTDDGYLPFEDHVFDFVINRHEFFVMSEVRRVLKPGGMFITQQVGGENIVDLSTALIPGFVNRFPAHTLKNNAEIIKSQGFEILLQDEAFLKLRFDDVGAIVYFAKACVWNFPDFSVQSCFRQLCGLQLELEEKGYLEYREHRFIIAAHKLTKP